MTKTELLLELNVFVATALIVGLGGWPGWGMVVFYVIVYGIIRTALYGRHRRVRRVIGSNTPVAQ